MSQKIDYHQVINLLSTKDDLTITEYTTLIQAYRNFSLFDEAISVAEIANNRYPQNINLLSETSWIYETIKDYVTSENILTQIIAIDAGKNVISSKIYKRLVQCYCKLAYYHKAKMTYDKAISIYGENDKNLINLKPIFTGDLKIPGEHNGVILLTTYPEVGSQNVGDKLITFSLIKLIKKRYENFNPLVLWREQSLDIYDEGSIRVILAPGFSVCNDTYPKLFKLYTLSTRLPNFIPLGCSFQSIYPQYSAFCNYQYNDETKQFLQKVSKALGGIYCRDKLIKDMLTVNDINALYMGDLALYDEDYIGQSINVSNDIKTIAVSVGHHIKYKYQTIELLDFIKNEYPKSKVILTLHGKPNHYSKAIIKYAESLDINIEPLFGNIEKLQLYDDIDIHIGYRLHAHIACIRKRKPSILLVEDARSYGFSKTLDTSLGCIQAYNIFNNRPSDTVIEEVREFLKWSLYIQFKNYDDMFKQLDNNFYNIVEPIINKLVKVLDNTH